MPRLRQSTRASVPTIANPWSLVQGPFEATNQKAPNGVFAAGKNSRNNIYRPLFSGRLAHLQSYLILVCLFKKLVIAELLRDWVAVLDKVQEVMFWGVVHRCLSTGVNCLC